MISEEEKNVEISMKKTMQNEKKWCIFLFLRINGIPHILTCFVPESS